MRIALWSTGSCRGFGPPDDGRSAKKCILGLASDQPNVGAMGPPGTEVARQKFDLAATVGNYPELYRSVLRDAEPLMPSKQVKKCAGISSS